SENYIQRVIHFAQQGYKQIEFKTYDTDWDSDAYLTVSGQNSNNSVRIINASNPCSEYMFLDDTACNLASLNLMTFLKEDGRVDIEAYSHAVRLWTVV